MMSTGGATIALTCVFGGLETHHYASINDLLYDVLTSHGRQAFEHFKQDIFPKAQKAWDEEEAEQQAVERQYARVPATDSNPGDDRSFATTPMPHVSSEEAYRQGWWAYGFGADEDRNPYPPALSVAGDSWLEGWHDAQEQHGG